MENKVRVFDIENACYGFASTEEVKDNTLATISVEFYKNKAHRKDDTPRYELIKIREVKRTNLK